MTPGWSCTTSDSCDAGDLLFSKLANPGSNFHTRLTAQALATFEMRRFPVSVPELP